MIENDEQIGVNLCTIQYFNVNTTTGTEHKNNLSY